MTPATLPFRIEASEDALQDLRRRLRATRWPDRETVDDWSQGIPLAYVQDVCAYWADKYDWRAREARLNRFPQFRTPIDGLGIHFLHVRSPHEAALPLVITHGWPGSIVEFHKVIEPLANPTAHGGEARDAFHVVCPSLPGYGFSDKPKGPGWKVERIARAWSELMQQLGYARYAAQGGDWGAMVTTAIGLQDTLHCVGIHLNMPIATPDPETMSDLTEAEKAALASMQHYDRWDSGYSKQQSTRPQTLGYGLVDSPAGQLAWILEKFWSWTDPRRAPRQRHALLAAGDRRLVGAPLLGELRDPLARAGHGSHRVQHLPEGDLPHLAALGREALPQARALPGAAARRALRRLRAAGDLRARGPRDLPRAALGKRSAQRAAGERSPEPERERGASARPG